MPKRTAKSDQRAHTTEEFLKYYKNPPTGDNIKPQLWDPSIFRYHHGHCMYCNCPPHHANMKDSTSPYICLACHKKQIGEENHDKLLEKLDKFQSATQAQSLKEILSKIKKKLRYVVKLPEPY